MVQKQINSKKGNVYYWINKHDNSDVKCIVFTHGLTANHNMFEKQIPFFEPTYTIITSLTYY
jgi:hypothetical protein